MKPVTLEVVTSPNCHICRLFDDFWQTIKQDWPNVSYRKVDVTTAEGAELAAKHTIMASPGILLNGKLFSVGGFNKNSFLDKLKELSHD